MNCSASRITTKKGVGDSPIRMFPVLNGIGGDDKPTDECLFRSSLLILLSLSYKVHGASEAVL